MASGYRFGAPPSPWAGQGNTSGYSPWIDSQLFRQQLVVGAPDVNSVGNTSNIKAVKPLQIDLSGRSVPVADGTGLEVKMAAGVAATSYPIQVKTSTGTTVFYVAPDGTISTSGEMITNRLVIQMEDGQTDDPLEIKTFADETIFYVDDLGQLVSDGFITSQTGLAAPKVNIDMEDGQTDDPIEVKNSDNDVVFAVAPDGSITGKGSTDLSPYSAIMLDTNVNFDTNAQARYFNLPGTGDSPSSILFNAGASSTVTTITCPAAAADNYTADTHIIIWGPANPNDGIIYFSTTTTMPAGVDFRVNSPVTNGETGAQIATALANAINSQAVGEWTASVSTNVVTVTTTHKGPCTARTVFDLPAGLTATQAIGTGMCAGRLLTAWSPPKDGMYRISFMYHCDALSSASTTYHVGLAEVISDTYVPVEVRTAQEAPTNTVSFDRYFQVGDGLFTPYINIGTLITETAAIFGGYITFSAQYIRQDPDLF